MGIQPESWLSARWKAHSISDVTGSMVPGMYLLAA
jgi:hypothetical protein